MLKKDYKRFLMALTKTKVSLPGMNLSKEEEAIRLDVFWEELRKYPIEQVEDAFQWARGSLAFFPKPVELTNYLEGKRNTHSPDSPLIDWQEPTEAGKKLALKMFGELKERWRREDEKRDSERKATFEKKRASLKKQAKLLEHK